MDDLVPDGPIQAPAGAIDSGSGAELVPDSEIIAPNRHEEQIGAAQALGRGALQGLSFGFSDEIAGAIGSLFSDKSYEQVRDESRASNAAAESQHKALYTTGEIGGGLATSFIPGLNVAKGASIAGAAAKAAGLGAAAGLGSSEAKDFRGLAMDTAKSALIGGVVGGAAQGLGKAVQAAPEAAKADLLKLVTQGEGKFGGATNKLKKLVAAQEDNIVKTLTEKIPAAESPTGKAMSLASIIGKPAKEVLPVLEERMNQIGEQLGPHYDQVDKVTGGIKVSNISQYLDDAVAELKKHPLNETSVKAINDLKESVLNAWAPDLKGALMSDEAQIPSVKKAILSQLDQQVPTREVRKLVTELQQRGTEVINALNPGKSTQVKQELAVLGKKLIDQELDKAANLDPATKQAVFAIRELNKPYSALATMKEAVEQRGIKETNQSMSGHGLLTGLLGHGGLVGAVALAMHGNIPGAIAAAALPKVIEKAPAIGRGVTRTASRAADMFKSLQVAAQNGNPWALKMLQGLPQATAMPGELHSPGQPGQ